MGSCVSTWLPVFYAKNELYMSGLATGVKFISPKYSIEVRVESENSDRGVSAHCVLCV